MKAIVTMTLVKPTRFGRTKTTEVINARKEQLVNEVNNFSFTRQYRENFIKVVEFSVKCYDYKNRVYNSWSYKPTYTE